MLTGDLLKMKGFFSPIVLRFSAIQNLCTNANGEYKYKTNSNTNAAKEQSSGNLFFNKTK